MTAPVQATSIPAQAAAAGRVSRFAGQTKLFPWLLFAPTIVYLLLLSIFPLVYSLYVSFHDYTLGAGRTFIGFDNYAELLTDRVFWRKTWVTLQITLIAVGAELALGLACALVLNRRLPGMGALRLIIYLPMMLSPLVVGYFWRFMLDGSFGVVNYFLSLVGIPAQGWISGQSLTLAKASIIIVDVWQWTPFVILILLAGLQTVPPQLYEAATLDRASTWLQFRRITLPYLATPILLALLFRTIDTFKLFDVVFIVTGGGPGDETETLSVLAFREGFTFFHLGKGAAISWLVVIVINVLATILIRTLTRRRSREVLDAEEALA